MNCTPDTKGRPGAFRADLRVPFLPPREGGWFRLEIPARIDSVGPMCAFLTVLCERHDLSVEETRAAEIAAYEICLNIIEHAYGFDRKARIVLRVRFGDSLLVLSFLDRGKSVDPEKVPPPDVTDPRVRLQGRGLGLELIRNSVDRIRFRKTLRGENHLLLIKKLSPRGLGLPGRDTDPRSGGGASG
ncbi:MAG: ATP-binding protein [Candidatus Eisenbacteria bacterium]